MHLTNTLLTIMAAALVVTAAPPPKPDNNDIEARWDCPNGWATCGVCHSLYNPLGPFDSIPKTYRLTRPTGMQRHIMPYSILEQVSS